MEGAGPCAKQWRRARGAVAQQGSGGMSPTAECMPVYAHEQAVQAVQAVETLQHIKGDGDVHHGPLHVREHVCVRGCTGFAMPALDPWCRLAMQPRGLALLAV
jgi:hypothetical protein